MSAFDPAAFDAAAFDAGTRDDVYGAGSISWRAVVVIGGLDVSERLAGQLKISGAESSARLAEFFIAPLVSTVVGALSGSSVTIDIVINGNGKSITKRRFTGSVVDWDYAAEGELISISARDGYQERINGCRSQADVLALLGPAVTQCEALAPWSDSTPEPATFFDRLASTAQGAYFIDGAGVWKFAAWQIGEPVAVFTDDQFYDETIKVMGSSKTDLPASILASLTARVFRLCAVDVPLAWSGLDYQIVGRSRGSWPSVSTVMSALAGLNGWHVKGTPQITHPALSYTITTAGGGTAAMLIDQPQQIAIGLAATMHHRWYQSVDLTFSVEIPLGGESDRDMSIADSISSDFDAGAWESAARSTTSNSIYAAHPPTSSAEASGEAAGYEGLPAPWPGSNASMLYFPDIGEDGLQAATEFVVAKAVRQAAAGLRKRRVVLERPVDPRWEIGDVVQVATFGIAARGQIVDFEDLLDHDSGDAATTMTIACPAGNGTVPGWSAAFTLPAPVAIAAPASPTLSNFVGADTETSTSLTDDQLLGFLSNTSGSVAQYDAAAPAYVPQFRIVMPEIAAELRDPATCPVDINVTWSISDGDLEVGF